MDWTERQKWLESLKVGDQVCYSTGWGGWYVTNIERETATQLILNNRVRIRRKDGYSVGDRYTRIGPAAPRDRAGRE